MGIKSNLNGRVFLSRFIAVALFITVLAGSWDAWWHGAVGRDTFWEPAHLLLYSSVIVAIGAGMYGWYRTREKLWRRLAFILLLVPISAPFDELWHRAFGVEDLSSPLIVWSPPHLALIFAVVASLFLLLPLLRQEKDVSAQRFFGSLVFAGLLTLFLFVAGPVQPTGPWELLGFWGAGIVAFMFTGILLMAQKWMPGVGSATLIIVFFLLTTSIGFGEVIAEGVTVVPHDHAPPFLTIFSFLLPAVVIDMLRKKALWLRGGLSGLLWAGLFYGLASRFFEAQFQYSTGDALVAIIASVIGGVVAGIFIKYYKNRTG